MDKESIKKVLVLGDLVTTSSVYNRDSARNVYSTHTILSMADLTR